MGKALEGLSVAEATCSCSLDNACMRMLHDVFPELWSLESRDAGDGLHKTLDLRLIGHSKNANPKGLRAPRCFNSGLARNPGIPASDKLRVAIPSATAHKSGVVVNQIERKHCGSGM